MHPHVYENRDFDTEIAKFFPRQQDAVNALNRDSVKFLLYGGAMGGGKSRWLRWYCVRFLTTAYYAKGLKWVQVMLACEDYPTLKDRQVVKIEREFPPWLGKSYADHKVYGRCFILNPTYGNGVINLRNLDDASKYASAEFAMIAVDELTKNSMGIFDDLRTRLRWPGLKDHECKFIAGTNPGSVGHGWVKNLWITKNFPESYYPPLAETDLRPQFYYVPSKADDNPHLDASYWATLSTLPMNMRKAFREGDWSTFMGQVFQEWEERYHVVPVMPVPENAPVYVTYDWGFGKPFSIGWWWVDGDGRLYRFHELYGWNGIADVGLRLADSEVARKMWDEEEKLNDMYHVTHSRVVARIAGHDCFARRPNPFGGGLGPPTSETFKTYKSELVLRPGDPNRVLKIRQFHNRLAVPEDGSIPMVQVYSTCKQFMRTIPDLVADDNNIEDVQTKGEDHCFQGLTLITTSKGDYPIHGLVGTSGFVWTVDGWSEYKNCRMVKRDAPLVYVQFDDGSSITCTPDHEFMTIGGEWKKAIDLLDETCYVSIQKPKQEASCESELSAGQYKNLMGKGSTYVGNTFATMGSYFTGLFGNITKVLSHLGMKSTIKDWIGPKTVLGLWLSNLSQNIIAFMESLMTIPTGWKQCTEGPTGGMEVIQVENGIRSNISSIVGWPLLQVGWKNGVSNADRCLLGPFSQSIVQENVQNSTGGNRVLGQRNGGVPSASRFSRLYGPVTSGYVRERALQSYDGKGLRVVRVLPSGRDDVYCLTVPRLHSFFLPNGILTSNCYDESCNIFMFRPITNRVSANVNDLERWKRPTTLQTVAKAELDEIWEQVRAEEAAMGNQAQEYMEGLGL